MKRLEEGTEIDGFRVGACIHSGGVADIYEATYANGRPPPFPMVMKVPRMTASDGAENIIGYEVEVQVMQSLRGACTPRFVAAGDIESLPYIVMEHIEGETLQALLDRTDQALPVQEIQRIGVALATALQGLHRQEVCHLDLKPANVLLKPGGDCVLLDFGLSCHAHLPDLHAEELRKAVGSPVWISPEQIVGVRGDPRSDVFSAGVILYELATRALAFGIPQTAGGLRQRLWADPVPPRKRRADLPGWLQEVILRCLEPEAAQRYPSAAHLAFDLSHPDSIRLTDRGQRVRPTPFREHFKRWLRAAGKQYQPSPVPSRQIDEVPIVMVAVPHEGVSDATLYSLREAAQRSLGTRPGARLACVTVIAPVGGGELSEADVHRHHLGRLQQWSRGLDLATHQVSYHVIESSDVAHALLRYADGNAVSIIVMGAATHGLHLQRLVATVPIKVAMQAPCTVLLVKQSLPFVQWPRAEGPAEAGQSADAMQGVS